MTKLGVDIIKQMVEKTVTKQPPKDSDRFLMNNMRKRPLLRSVIRSRDDPRLQLLKDPKNQFILPDSFRTEESSEEPSNATVDGNEHVPEKTSSAVSDEHILTIRDPFKALGMSMNEPQRVLQQKLDNDMFKKYVCIPISSACGSGKTMMGLQMIYHLKQVTLIISTRIYIKEQWMKEICKIWPDAIISMNSFKNNKADIYIVSPQWLTINDNMKDIPERIGFIIYDEIHSMLSGAFANVLKVKHICYRAALSATFPNSSSDEYKLMFSHFGKPIQLPATDILSAPIKIYSFPYRSPYELINIILIHSGLKRGKLTKNIRSRCSSLKSLKDCDKNHKFVCITHYIKESIQCCQQVAEYLPGKYIVIRDSTKGMFLVDSKDIVGKSINDSNINEFGTKIHMDEIDSSDAIGIFGCNARLREGVNIKTLYFGISTAFFWSISFRIQILGRIRRIADGVERHFVVSYGDPPRNDVWRNGVCVFYGHDIYPHKEENEEFIKNNISYVD